MSNGINNKDLIRSLTVGAKKNFAKKEFTYEYNGKECKVEFRELTVKRTRVLQKKATVVTKYTDDKGKEREKSELDGELFMFYLIIEMTYDPETGEKVFTEEDLPAILEMPSIQNFLKPFSDEISDMIKDENVKEKEKNYKEMPEKE